MCVVPDWEYCLLLESDAVLSREEVIRYPSDEPSSVEQT